MIMIPACIVFGGFVPFICTWVWCYAPPPQVGVRRGGWSGASERLRHSPFRAVHSCTWSVVVEEANPKGRRVVPVVQRAHSRILIRSKLPETARQQESLDTTGWCGGTGPWLIDTWSSNALPAPVVTVLGSIKLLCGAVGTHDDDLVVNLFCRREAKQKKCCIEPLP